MARLPVRATTAIRAAVFVPYSTRPSIVIRRNAVRHGILGNSLAWRVVAFLFYGTQIVRKIYGKQSELVDRQRVGQGQFVKVSVFEPLSRKERKRTGVSRASHHAIALADIEAAKNAP